MKLTFFLFLILVTFSCSSPDENLFEIDPRIFVENEITLADIADDITYIPLDNIIPIGPIYTYKIVNSSIYLSAKDIGILAFNRDGKFIRKIGAIGRGPGEYHYCMNFDIDPKLKSVYLLDGNIIKVYAGSGQYQRSISLKEYGSRFLDDIDFYNGKLLISDYIYMGETKYSWLILDTTGILLKKKYNPIPTFDSNLPSAGGSYFFDDKIFYWELYNDTVYSILPDLSYKASFLFSAGEHRWPKSHVSLELESFISFLTNHMQIFFMFETKRFLVFRYLYKKQAIALIDKKSKKTFLTYMESDENTGHPIGGILNNLDGGTMYQPRRYFVENDREYMVGLVDSYQLKAHIASEVFKNSTPKYPEKKKELEKLADSLKETDNPVLMVVKLKK